ncbi:hypothetical protein [Tenacibaculum soleae]|uniref:hypothetical protein n=1 Tax=Tenacibaculum soleae TaxID=447689 RepID=UPI00230140FD|nr:hypothetical protein [Tenacibaculum soleae]
MNSAAKYYQEKEDKEYWEKKAQTRIYYLQRKLKEKGIKYNSRAKTVFPIPDITNDPHVKALLNEFKYTIQTIID